MILATGAVHTHLLRQQLRTFTSLNVRSGECLDVHHFARADRRRRHHGERLSGRGQHRRPPSPRPVRRAARLEECLKRYREALDQGLLKIMSKMGIAVISLLSRRRQLRGARPVAHAGRGISSPACPRASPASAWRGIQQQSAGSCTARAWSEDVAALPIGGFYRYRARRRGPCLGGRPDPHAADRRWPRESYQTFKQLFSEAMAKLPPIAIRDLLDFEPTAEPIADRRGGIHHRDPQALRHAGHVAGRAVARGARHAQHRHEPDRRQVGFRRGRRGSGALPARGPTATTPTPPSSRWPRAASASRRNTSTTAASSRSRSRRAPSPAKAASCPASR